MVRGGGGKRQVPREELSVGKNLPGYLSCVRLGKQLEHGERKKVDCEPLSAPLCICADMAEAFLEPSPFPENKNNW